MKGCVKDVSEGIKVGYWTVKIIVVDESFKKKFPSVTILLFSLLQYWWMHGQAVN